MVWREPSSSLSTQMNGLASVESTGVLFLRWTFFSFIQVSTPLQVDNCFFPAIYMGKFCSLSLINTCSSSWSGPNRSLCRSQIFEGSLLLRSASCCFRGLNCSRRTDSHAIPLNLQVFLSLGLTVYTEPGSWRNNLKELPYDYTTNLQPRAGLLMFQPGSQVWNSSIYHFSNSWKF